MSCLNSSSGTVVASTEFAGNGFLLLDVKTGQPNVIDETVFADASEEVQTFEFELVARVLLSTDTITSTYNVNVVKAHHIIIFKNS